LTDTSPHPEQLEPTQLRGRHKLLSKSMFHRGGRSARFLVENRKLMAQIDTQRRARQFKLRRPHAARRGCDFSENAQLQTVLRRFPT
jgi:hypothetical protein